MNKKTGLISIILLITGIALYAFSMVFLPIEDMLSIPESYEKISSIQMSEKHENSVVYKLELSEAMRSGFYVWTNAKDDKTLVLDGPNNTKIGLMAGKVNISNPEFTLQPGSYTLKLTNTAQSGTLVIYAMEKKPAQK